MMVMTPYPGFEGKYFSMPCRNVVPKPLQKPHPPIWVACSNRETIKLAAQLGVGALTFAFVDPAKAKQWVDDCPWEAEIARSQAVKERALGRPLCS
jgi:alkanesulfonate monooxygenase SsuD/methylene tetrahydromethanopterin reductase-like flavin-dependent oxidoreductase (luciferase family)